jgi:hypothetical protein
MSRERCLRVRLFFPVMSMLVDIFGQFDKLVELTVVDAGFGV